MPKDLVVVLVHGTWTTSRKWKEPDSNFRKWLEARLIGRSYRSIKYRAIEWNGFNRWDARARAANELTETLRKLATDLALDDEVLVVGHSHGGNIATEAVRNFLIEKPDFKLVGVACLNTPFLKHELRASSSFLAVWLIICLLIGIAASVGSSFAEANMLQALEISQTLFRVTLTPSKVSLTLFVFAAALTLAVLMNRRLVRLRDKEENIWGPRPPVLCLSCADDEAITLLGLGEGIANFPQLLFHPVALTIAVISTALFLLFHHNTYFCPGDLQCWVTGGLATGVGLIRWIGFAMFGGLLGSLGISFLFGLSRRMFWESLVSRVLVTYTPLKPADVSFRAIVDVRAKWSFAQILHSRIYESEVAIEELCNWIVARNKFGAKMREVIL